MKLVDFPAAVPSQDYQAAMDRMVARLSAQQAVTSIYQVGGVSAAGISDIDLFVVFKDNTSCEFNPLEGLSRQDRYLFVHSLFGMCASDFRQSLRYAFFHNFHHLWGNELEFTPSDLDVESTRLINIQAGLEYMIKCFITMSIEKTYGILKVRHLLLYVKALRFDLDYLGVHSGRLIDFLAQIIEWRENWYDSMPRHREIETWFFEFYEALQEELSGYLALYPFYVPAWADMRVAANMKFIPSSRLGFQHTGFVLPSLFGGLGRRYFNIQNRFNRFEFGFPIISDNVPSLYEERHLTVTRFFEYNARYLPRFMPGAYGLPVFRCA